MTSHVHHHIELNLVFVSRRLSQNLDEIRQYQQCRQRRINRELLINKVRVWVSSFKANIRGNENYCKSGEGRFDLTLSACGVIRIFLKQVVFIDKTAQNKSRYLLSGCLESFELEL